MPCLTLTFCTAIDGKKVFYVHNAVFGMLQIGCLGRSRRSWREPGLLVSPSALTHLERGMNVMPLRPSARSVPLQALLLPLVTWPDSKSNNELHAIASYSRLQHQVESRPSLSMHGTTGERPICTWGRVV